MSTTLSREESEAHSAAELTISSAALGSGNLDEQSYTVHTRERPSGACDIRRKKKCGSGKVRVVQKKKKETKKIFFKKRDSYDDDMTVEEEGGVQQNGRWNCTPKTDRDRFSLNR